ncbi:AraC family transcriptional regulator [uncultured Massilia sp.]|uniref:AraC family transcriptional regulator n=1 Tax=uncultured Massilia sp. TaxID=169973 RepID=UPI0025D8FBD9|nr:AraC family transcriptional regulator [uncultured Massilia sp.]
MTTVEETTLDRLRSLLLRHAHAPSAAVPGLPRVALMAASAPLPAELHVCEPTFTLVVQGRARTALGAALFDCGPGQCLVLPVDLPVEAGIVEASADRPFLGLRLALDAERIAALLLDASRPLAPAVTDRAIVAADADAAVMAAVLRLLALLDTPDDLPVLGEAFERELLWRLLNGAQGATIRQIGLANSRMAQVGKAIRHIRRHHAETLRVEALAAGVGMSVTSFHRHFRAITSMTPVQYQKQIRLQLARARLVAGEGDVGAVGFAVGYDSPSQFSREYRRMFGAPPGRDGRRLREAGGKA